MEIDNITINLINKISYDIDRMEEELNDRIIQACKNDKSHTMRLSENEY